eukprot:50018_1
MMATSFTVPFANSKKSDFNVPLHIIARNKRRNRKNKSTIHDITGKNSNTDSMITELIDRLCITKRSLSPTVLIDMIALIVRSYLAQELHIQVTQPLRYLIHSPYYPFGIALFPPRKHNITHPLAFNDKIQFESVASFQLGAFAFKFAMAVFIGTHQYQTLIVSTPRRSCLYLQRDSTFRALSVITDEVIHLWKQDNSCIAYALTRGRVIGRSRESRLQLFMITISDANGQVFVDRVMEQSLVLPTAVDYRIFGAYYLTQSVQLRHGFPFENCLIVVGDLNIIITTGVESHCIRFKNDINLRSLWYCSAENRFIGIERNKYHLVSVVLHTEKSELQIMDTYRKIKATGIQHCFYDTDKDVIVIYKQLMASSKFKHEIICLPVSSQLMRPEIAIQ